MNFWTDIKIRLRGIEATDANLFHGWNQDSERNRKLDFLYPPVGLGCVSEWVQEQSKKKLDGDCFQFVIESRDGEPVGTIATKGADHKNGTFSLAFDISEEHRRKGYASSAVMMVLRYYFKELRYQKVPNGVYAFNQASEKLHRQLGFVEEGLLRRMIFSDGCFHDKYLFGMTVEEFLERERLRGVA